MYLYSSIKLIPDINVLKVYRISILRRNEDLYYLNIKKSLRDILSSGALGTYQSLSVVKFIYQMTIQQFNPKRNKDINSNLILILKGIRIYAIT